jgi:surface antigen
VYVATRPNLAYAAPGPAVAAVPTGLRAPVNAARDGSYCREWQGRITVGGRLEQAYGTACLQPDGSWEFQP